MYCFSQFCRLCVSSNKNLINFFCIDDDFQMLGEKIRVILPEIVYEEDNIPNFVCDQCCNNVKKMYDFKKKCLKNNAILKLYASKLLNLKESPESNRDLENELKLLQKQLSHDTDINLSLVFVRKDVDNTTEETNETLDLSSETSKTKDELTSEVKQESINFKLDENSIDYEDNPLKIEENESVYENSIKVLRTLTSNVIKDQNFSNMVQNKEMQENIYSNVIPDLKLECTEEDDESYSGDDHGDESMDCEEVISINDSDNEKFDDDTSEEPMNLTSKAMNVSYENQDGSSCLPPHLRSGNRELEWRVPHNFCVYYGCTIQNTTQRIDKRVSLFRFPTNDKKRLELWLSAIANRRLRTLSVSELKNLFICSYHFEPKYFADLCQDRLKLNAVPYSLFSKPIKKRSYLNLPVKSRRENSQNKLVNFEGPRKTFQLEDTDKLLIENSQECSRNKLENLERSRKTIQIKDIDKLLIKSSQANSQNKLENLEGPRKTIWLKDTDKLLIESGQKNSRNKLENLEGSRKTIQIKDTDKLLVKSSQSNSQNKLENIGGSRETIQVKDIDKLLIKSSQENSQNKLENIGGSRETIHMKDIDKLLIKSSQENSQNKLENLEGSKKTIQVKDIDKLLIKGSQQNSPNEFGNPGKSKIFLQIKHIDKSLLEGSQGNLRNKLANLEESRKGVQIKAFELPKDRNVKQIENKFGSMESYEYEVCQGVRKLVSNVVSTGHQVKKPKFTYSRKPKKLAE